MSITHAPSGETLDVRGEIVVQCLEGEVAITDSAQTQNLHAGELLYLPAGEPHSVKGVENASLLLSIQDPEPNVSEENETIYARGAVLSVTQAVFLVISLALLFVAVASNIFAGLLVVSAVLGIVGCLHYWVWGRWMSPALLHPGRKEPH